MRVALVGNFEPEFSTENDLKWAMEQLGWEVLPLQSGEVVALTGLVESLRWGGSAADVIVWVRTASLWDRYGKELQWRLLAEARRQHLPVVGYHLDRWWGLRRQHEIDDEPFFYCDLLITADGGHDDQWAAAGINHVWFPPAVSERWCQPGEFKEELATDIVFTGSWQGGYHREWTHRPELVNWLQKTYGDRVAFHPKQGQHAVRGLALNDVYWSAKVVVGDSCLVPKPDGSPMTHYCSDRVPETLGRGGVLLHPSVEGVDDLFGWMHRWQLGVWSDLKARIDSMLEYGWPEVERINQIKDIREHHTYTIRMRQLEDLLRERGFIS